MVAGGLVGRVVLLALLSLAVSAPAGTAESSRKEKHPVVRMKTSMGEIEIELYPDKAPKTVENFLRYVREGFYDGTIFHRVVPNFVVQGGGYDAEMHRKPTHGAIPNEADNGLGNEKGTIAMARTSDPHSATSQFFINTKDNPFLDHKDKTPQGWGYTVFGRVVKGMDVVEKIGKVPTTRRAGMADVPVEPVVIEKVELVQ
ncbi:MAG: peptidyl-prolyl cis-trans isomerase [Candidatus Binatia bacterium]|nr:MAG: peptidyl-prolyl cis-trans isomerase [Candidatus Binatia bacterium]